MSGGGNQTTVEKADPWVGLQPHLTNLYNKAAGLASQDPTSLVAGFAPGQEMGMQGGMDYANRLTGMMNPMLQSQGMLMSPDNPMLNAMSGTLTPAANTLTGMMNPQQNPYLDQMVQNAMGNATDVFNQNMSNVRDETFASGQNIGDTAYMRGLDVASNNLGDMLSNITNTMYGSAYENDMNRALNATGMSLGGYSDASQNIMRALGLAPTTFQTGAMPFGMMTDIGSMEQAMNQSYLDAPNNQLVNFANLLGSNGMPGGTATSTTGGGYNPILGALGGGMGAYGMANTMGMTTFAPYYALAGAALGAMN